MPNKRKMCAVCGTKIQSNVVLLWKRNSDQVVFNVCAACAEGKNGHRVNAETVQIKETRTYTTIALLPWEN